MVGSQTANLTLGPFFGHNLCSNVQMSNMSPIWNIYVLIAFQRYKKPFKQMNFDPCDCTLKIWDPIWTPIWEFTWECEGSFPHSLCTPGNMWCDSWVSFLAHNLATPFPGREPKAKVTHKFLTQFSILKPHYCFGNISLVQNNCISPFVGRDIVSATIIFFQDY